MTPLSLTGGDAVRSWSPWYRMSHLQSSVDASLCAALSSPQDCLIDNRMNRKMRFNLFTWGIVCINEQHPLVKRIFFKDRWFEVRHVGGSHQPHTSIIFYQSFLELRIKLDNTDSQFKPGLGSRTWSDEFLLLSTLWGPGLWPTLVWCSVAKLWQQLLYAHHLQGLSLFSHQGPWNHVQQVWSAEGVGQ